MADPQIPASTTTTPPDDALLTRGDGSSSLSLDRLNQAVPLAMRTQLLDAEQKLLTVTSERDEERKLRAEAEAQLVKAGGLHQAHVLDKDLITHKADTDALKKARELTDEAERTVGVREQCKPVAAEIAALAAACAQADQRATQTSGVVGGVVGLTVGALLGSTRRHPSSSPGLVGFSGVATAVAPLAIQHLMRSTTALASPTTAGGWDAHLLALVAERDRLLAALAARRSSNWSPIALAAGLLGGGALGFALSAPSERQRGVRRRSRR